MKINLIYLHTKGLFSSSSPSPSLLLTRLLSCSTGLGVLLLEGFISGTIFNVIPMAMSKRPVPCCSVKGFVNIKYDRNSVTAFLAVVICMPIQPKYNC
uniref:Uncharacterized protein MANES_02G028000 n=1 Tax=Rhizophora mucronata TaxID=61149 RepID=A0A2P2JU21_RHIMU